MDEEKLLHLLRKKKGVFESILELSESEMELPVHEWISILEQKKILLACVDEIDKELNGFQNSLHVLSQEITEEIDKMRKIIQEILRLDTLNQDKRKWELGIVRNRNGKLL